MSARVFPSIPQSCEGEQFPIIVFKAVGLHAVYYNFARIHKTLRIMPSIAAGLSDHVWSLEEIVMMADNYLPKPGKRGPYKKGSCTDVV